MAFPTLKMDVKNINKNKNNIDKIKYFLIIGKKKIKDIKYKAVRKIDVLSPDR